MRFELKKVKNKLGMDVDTLFQIDDQGKEEAWCNVLDIDILFDTCVRRWGENWDLNKVCVAVEEASFN